MAKSFRAKKTVHTKPNNSLRSSILVAQRKEKLLKKEFAQKPTSANLSDDPKEDPTSPNASRVNVPKIGSFEHEPTISVSKNLEGSNLILDRLPLDNASPAVEFSKSPKPPCQRLEEARFTSKKNTEHAINFQPTSKGSTALTSGSQQRTLVRKKNDKSLQKETRSKKSTSTLRALESKPNGLGSHSSQRSKSPIKTFDQVNQWSQCSEVIPDSHKRTSTLISQFHTIEKILARTTNPIERKKLLKEQSKLGGLNTYQAASSYAGSKEKGGETGKWCAKALEEIFRCKKNITLLDVGAISGTSYQKFPWIQTTSIDLNPQDEEKVLKYDFLKFPIPDSDSKKFDVIGLSLVLNFVGDLKRRSEMIQHAHLYLKPFGYLYIVLPLACIENSRYLDSERFTNILNSLGFVPVKQHNSTKLTFWLSQRSGSNGYGIIQKHIKWNKEEIRKGANRNNFCIKV
ncbi:hypothetical protein CROQUDRAFT_80887 [Cronartium quercuum f. sp. fusiforme G11]|uniref:25S rRNA adenine-N(1) methyltransferase n=1 Tax=Cronartium quercuum f. sp. fusiforme G11 TaxID=708437 RepID=A0A9P6T8Z1_9BASI|nr:hypothetical protein CROQUDRAFT_80887 [Cronartium quercuum f. sp. fusiforme G11]